MFLRPYDHSKCLQKTKGGSWCNNTKFVTVAVHGNSQATYAM